MDGVLPPTTASDGSRSSSSSMRRDDDPRLDGFAAADDTAGEVRRPDRRRDLDVPADPDAARDHRPLADDRDAGVEPARLLRVGPVVHRTVADDRARARPRPPCR